MKKLFIFFTLYLAFTYCNAKCSKYVIGQQGQSCSQVCYGLGMNCNPHIVTDNTLDIFNELGISCTPNLQPWWAEDQPSYVSDPSDPNYGRCVGYIDVPSGVQCAAFYPTVSRLCRCDEPSSQPTFGTGFSNGWISTTEQWIFEHVVQPGDVGVLTHFWTTYQNYLADGVIIRYYIDGETTASIQFTPSLACGVGYLDQQAPWGTEWFGKGANDAGWFNNFRIPFQKSIVITAQHLYGDYPGFYMIVRGATNIPITVGGVTLPRNAKMNQIVTQGTYQPFDFVPLVNIPSGAGALWMVTLSAGSGNLNFLEGCIHAYFDGDNEFPGVIIATGTEDYFDSAWYFNAGQFHLPNAGFTHLDNSGSYVTWSAYRFHDQDPLFFNDGFQFVWRNGDLLDNDSGKHMKCMIESGGISAGNPTASDVLAYAWVYTW